MISTSLTLLRHLPPPSLPPHHRHFRNRIYSAASAAQLTTKTTIVIGGGLSGLSAATKLQSSNIPFLLLESSDGIGGRVRTDFVDGFLLDRGFQIFITAYPEARNLLDYPSLNLEKCGFRI